MFEFHFFLLTLKFLDYETWRARLVERDEAEKAKKMRVKEREREKQEAAAAATKSISLSSQFIVKSQNPTEEIANASNAPTQLSIINTATRSLPSNQLPQKSSSLRQPSSCKHVIHDDTKAIEFLDLPIVRFKKVFQFFFLI